MGPTSPPPPPFPCSPSHSSPPLCLPVVLLARVSPWFPAASPVVRCTLLRGFGLLRVPPSRSPLGRFAGVLWRSPAVRPPGAHWLLLWRRVRASSVRARRRWSPPPGPRRFPPVSPARCRAFVVRPPASSSRRVAPALPPRPACRWGRPPCPARLARGRCSRCPRGVCRCCAPRHRFSASCALGPGRSCTCPRTRRPAPASAGPPRAFLPSADLGLLTPSVLPLPRSLSPVSSPPPPVVAARPAVTWPDPDTSPRETRHQSIPSGRRTVRVALWGME